MRATGPIGGRDRAGAALAVAILFALVILVSGHGILVFTRTQRWITAADGLRWTEDQERQAALRAVLAGLDSLPGGGLVDTQWGLVQVRTLGPELRLLSADPDPGSPGMGWATLVAAPMPVPRVSSRSGAIRVGGAVFEGGSRPVGPSDEVCLPGLGAVALARVGPLPDSVPRPRLGVLDFEDLLDAFPRLGVERLDLPGSGSAACEEAGGFGDPDRPGSCPDVWGAGARIGDLTVSGRGQGVLAVSGDLTLGPEAHFRGWVWVGGSLRVASGAELRGLADVGERFVSEPGGAFRPDGCAGALVLEAVGRGLRPKGVGPDLWPRFRP